MASDLDFGLEMSKNVLDLDLSFSSKSPLLCSKPEVFSETQFITNNRCNF